MVRESIFRLIQEHMFHGHGWRAEDMVWAKDPVKGYREFFFLSLKRLQYKDVTPAIMEDACRLVAEMLCYNVPLDVFEKSRSFCLCPVTGRLCVIPSAIKRFGFDLNLEALGNIWYFFASLRNKCKWPLMIEFRQVYQALLPGSFNRRRVEAFLCKHGFWPVERHWIDEPLELPSLQEEQAFQERLDEGKMDLSLDHYIDELFRDDFLIDYEPEKEEEEDSLLEFLKSDFFEVETSPEPKKLTSRTLKILKQQERFGLAHNGKQNFQAMAALAEKVMANFKREEQGLRDELDRLNKRLVITDYPDYGSEYRMVVLPDPSSSSCFSSDTVSSEENDNDESWCSFLQCYNPEPNDGYLWRLVQALVEGAEWKDFFMRGYLACEQAVFCKNQEPLKSMAGCVWDASRLSLDHQSIYRMANQEQSRKTLVPPGMQAVLERFRIEFGDSIRNLWEEALRLRQGGK